MSSPPPGRGRPRDHTLDERILEQVLVLLASHGYAGLTLDELATRSGVAKTTILRRWPSKAAVAAAGVERLALQTVDASWTDHLVSCWPEGFPPTRLPNDRPRDATFHPLIRVVRQDRGHRAADDGARPQWRGRSPGDRGMVVLRPSARDHAPSCPYRCRGAAVCRPTSLAGPTGTTPNSSRRSRRR